MNVKEVHECISIVCTLVAKFLSSFTVLLKKKKKMVSYNIPKETK